METQERNATQMRKKWILVGSSVAVIAVVAVVLILVLLGGKQASSDKSVSSEIKKSKKASVGDCVMFGTYEQDNVTSNGAEAIEWIVLDKKDGKALLLSRYALDCKPYHEEWEAITWEDCTLRSWLNDTFYTTAFSKKERGYIATTTVINDDNPEYGTEGGNNTKDKVFLLSIDEVTSYSYFSSNWDEWDVARRCQVTEYAKAQGGWAYSEAEDGYYGTTEYDGNGWWRLRSPGDSRRSAAFVSSDGSVARLGYNVDFNHYVVRPALWVDIESMEEAEVTPTPTPKPSTELSSVKKISKASVGDYVTFGTYEQDNVTSNGAEAIEWLVLDKKDGKTLLLSRYALDEKTYHDADVKIVWEYCTLRNWLNEEFFESAFSESEQKYIAETHVINKDNPRYETEGGNDTVDKVFLLSIEEVTTYFDSAPDELDPARRVQVTEYAKAQGAWTYGEREYGEYVDMPEYDDNSWWWLRSAGSSISRAAYVVYDGGVSERGELVYTNKVVRPAVWVDSEMVEESVVIPETPTEDLIREIREASVGDYVSFGNYEQDNVTENGAETIRWRVLDKQKDKVLLLSNNALDSQKYHTEMTAITWEDCSLRSWLNEEFYETAFDKSERKYIAETHVINADNPTYGTEGGNDTYDKVFLLSIGELTTYFDSESARYDKARGARITEYAKANGTWNEKWDEEYDRYGWWLSRTPGYRSTHVACVEPNGNIDLFGTVIGHDGYQCYVRPAVWIDLEPSGEEESVGMPTRVPEVTVTEIPEPTVIPEPKPTATPEPTVTEVPEPSEVLDAVREIGKASVGDYVMFGTYEQDNMTSNGAEDIEWLVLDKKDGKALLLSKYGLEAKPYNEEWGNITWEDCTLRGWLNDEFYKTAFSKREQEYIVETYVVNEDNPWYGTDGGNDTYDKVFLLSTGEVTTYFDSDPNEYDWSRRVQATEYAKVRVRSYGHIEEKGNFWWYLRTPGYENVDVAGVACLNYVDYHGFTTIDSNIVRPALWINIESAEAAEVTPTTKPSAELDSVQEISKASVGDYVTFGTYEQDNVTSNGPEDIDWIVLDKKDGKALLLSRYALDAKPYHEEWKDITWEDCTLRSWLNDTFYTTAFSKKERGYIATTTVINDDNPEYGTEGGNNTKDKVFLLSIDEVTSYSYFSSNWDEWDVARRCQVTEYAKVQGGWAYSEEEYGWYGTTEYDGNGWWWLRSPGNYGGNAALVYFDGRVDRLGNRVVGNAPVVRPALWVEY